MYYVTIDPRTWHPPATIVARMGKDSDAQLGRECGVSDKLIRDYRERYQVAPATSSTAIDWAALDQTILGTMPDAEAGEILGVAIDAVTRRRIKLGIPAFRPKVARWTDAMLAVLIGEPDNARAAEALGMGVGGVRTARHRYRERIAAILSSTMRTGSEFERRLTLSPHKGEHTTFQERPR
jgi:hypothetical protein